MRSNSHAEQFNLKETQIAIKCLKDYFERELSSTLNLLRVTAPLFVQPQTGLNDNLSGTEKAVDFYITKPQLHCEIVHSLAKWKRMALYRYGFMPYEGLYTDMNAIRADEDLDALHSAYVDQWDWEKIILREDRTNLFLQTIVREIYQVLLRTESYINGVYPLILNQKLPDTITFLNSQDMETELPSATPKEREDFFAKKYGAIFVQGIGWPLEHSNEPHDDRSPDYDDWKLNGDIIVWNPVLNSSFEISSMGIRVDAKSMKKQLEFAHATDRLELDFHKAIMEEKLPLTIGGGIGQSRLCQFFLEKRHIGEVQCSVWDDTTLERAKADNACIL